MDPRLKRAYASLSSKDKRCMVALAFGALMVVYHVVCAVASDLYDVVVMFNFERLHILATTLVAFVGAYWACIAFDGSPIAVMVDAVEKEQFTNPMVSMVTKWVFSTADSHPSEPKNGFHGPFYVLYRSNVLFSGLSSSQGLVQDGGPFDDLQKAVHEYAKKKGQLHGYGVCDKDGNVVVYNAATTSSFVKKFCAAAIRQETKQTTASAGPAAEEKNESHSGDTRPEPPGGFKPPFYVLYRSKVPASGLSPAGGLVKDGGPFANVPQALQHYERKKGGIFYKYGVCDQEGNLVTCDAVVQTRSFNTPKCCQAAIPASSTTESGPSASLQEMLETQSVEQSSPGILAKTFFQQRRFSTCRTNRRIQAPFLCFVSQQVSSIWLVCGRRPCQRWWSIC